jgi:hypothetical protein
MSFRCFNSLDQIGDNGRVCDNKLVIEQVSKSPGNYRQPMIIYVTVFR